MCSLKHRNGLSSSVQNAVGVFLCVDTVYVAYESAGAVSWFVLHVINVLYVMYVRLSFGVIPFVSWKTDVVPFCTVTVHMSFTPILSATGGLGKLCF